MKQPNIRKNLFNNPLLIKIKALPLRRLFLSKSFVYGYLLDAHIFFCKRNETDTPHIICNSICARCDIAGKRTKRHHRREGQTARHLNNPAKALRTRLQLQQDFSPRHNDLHTNTYSHKPQLQTHNIGHHRQIHAGTRS